MKNTIYNNIINNTLERDKAAQGTDSLETARAVFNNMGVALPSGDMGEVSETLKTNDYMGWRACTAEEAQAAADRGVAAMGVSEDGIVVIAANDEDEPVTATASVMTLSNDATVSPANEMEYYAYSYGRSIGGGNDGGGTTTTRRIYFNESRVTVPVGWSDTVPVYGDTTSTMQWNCSDTLIAEVDDDGLIIAKACGEVTIRAWTNNYELTAAFTLVIEPCRKTVSIEQRIVGDALMGDGGFNLIMPQPYVITLNLTYVISEINGENAWVDSVSAFTKYDKIYQLEGVDSPDISIGITTLNGETLNMVYDNRDKLLSPDWVWDAKIAEVNRWIPLGSNVTTMATILLDASIYPYREVNLSTTIEV